MDLHGKSIIGNLSPSAVSSGGQTFRAYDPALGQELDPVFYEATDAEVNLAFSSAESAFDVYRGKSADEIAGFLNTMAENIIALGDELIARASAEAGLPTKRLTGERARTVANSATRITDKSGAWWIIN